MKNCRSVATWFSTLCFPSPVLDDVKIIGGISSQYSDTSRQNISTFSSGRARTPLFSPGGGRAFSGHTLDTTLRAMLCCLMPEAEAANYSWHSARIFLACALHARVLLRRAAVAAPGVDPRVRQMNVYGGAFAVAVAFAPEVVALVAKLRRRRGGDVAGAASLTLDLPSMGCVACVDAVSRAIRGVDGVVDASVTVGAATVSVTEANDAMAAAISDAVRRAGFPPGAVRWSTSKS